MTAEQTRWKRRKAARPQEILEAALGVFAEKGFARTRMEDIARQAVRGFQDYTRDWRELETTRSRLLQRLEEEG